MLDDFPVGKRGKCPLMSNNVTHVCLVEKASELQEVNDVLILHMGSDTATCLHNTTRIVMKMLLLFVQLHMFPGGHFQVRLQNIRKVMS